MTPLSQKAFWILLTVVIGTTLSVKWFEWMPIIVVAGALLLVVILSGLETLNNLFFLSIPLSVEISIPALNADMLFPSEPVALIISAFTLLNILFRRELWSKQQFHPSSLLLLVLWLTFVVSACTSNMPVVSIKALIIFTLYITSFYFQWFMYRDQAVEKIHKALHYYFAGLFIVCLFTSFKHASFGFEREMAMRVPSPFFSDHTIYGTCLAFFVPVIYYWIKTSSSTQKVFYIFAFVLFLQAIFTTYSRAVWLSLLAVLGINFLLRMKVDIRKLITVCFAFILLFVLFQEPIVEFLSENQSDSKARKAEVADQLKSVGNISTDVSNLERINRWKSALNMFNDKPWSGHGLGTYQFNFINYQNEADKTSISVTHASDHFSQGKGGTAHSQYLLYLSEAGVFAMLAFVLFILYILKDSFFLYYNSSDPKEQLFIKAIIGGFFTFVIHSFFNNFLDIDKAASLFYTFSASIILMVTAKRTDLTKIEH